MLSAIDPAAVPEWLGAAVIGAIIAALGYVAKLLIEAVNAVFARRQTRRAHLAKLLSLLRAGSAAYQVQCKNRDRLQEHRLSPERGSRSCSAVDGTARCLWSRHGAGSGNC